MPQEYLCTVKYACKNDDARFIHAPGVAYAKRIGWVYKVMRAWRRESEEIVLEILAGNEENVWLWVDGDEVAVPELWLSVDFPYALAAKALQTRQASECFESREMAQMRQRVQSASPKVRLAAILWLVLTSKAVKKLDSEQGLMDREEWDLSSLIWEWWFNLVHVWNQLPEAPTEEFERVMEKEGHTCHTELESEYGPKMVCRWLHVQSVLFPERADVPVNLVYWDWHDKKIHCDACRSYANQHHYFKSQQQNASYKPSPYAVFLAFVYYRTSHCRGPSFLEWVATLSSRRNYRKLMSGSAGRLFCQTIQPKLKRQPEDWNPRYASWINSYPSSWHYAFSMPSSRTWKIVDSILGSSDLSSEIGTTPDFATWLAAAMWTILIDAQSLTVGKRLGHLDWGLKMVIEELDPLLHPPNTDTVESFRQKIGNSSHTCWNGHDPGWYSCAVSYLNDENDPDFVPYVDFHDMVNEPKCKECRLVSHARQFAKRLSNSLHPRDEFSNNLASMNAQFQALDRVSDGGAGSTGVGDAESDEQPSMTDNEDVGASVHVVGTSIALDTIPQTTSSERTLQSTDIGSYETNLYNTTSDHLPTQGFQPLLHDISQPIRSSSSAPTNRLSLQELWQSNSLSDPHAGSVSQQSSQPFGSHEGFQPPTLQDITDYDTSIFAFSSHEDLPQNPPPYNDVSSTFDPPVSLGIENTRTVEYPSLSTGTPYSSRSHQLSQTIPPGPFPQPRTRTKGSQFKKAAVIQEVKQYIIKSLLGAGAKLGKFKDEYTLPWTQLEQDLKVWRIEMINWPEEVERRDNIKGINGLNDKEARILWHAVQNPDLEKRLQFRRLGSSMEEGRSRKRRADASDGDNPEGRSRPSKSQRLNVNGQCSQIVWDSTREFHSHG